MLTLPTLSDHEFHQFQKLFYQLTGIHLTSVKKMLVLSRLAKRLRHYHLNNYGEYLQLVNHSSTELQIMVNLLTTNETYFFREPEHFTYLREKLIPIWKTNNSEIRIWSAGCSSGEEPYSVAMVLMDTLGETAWEILGSDINEEVLEIARAAHYPMYRVRCMPAHYLADYCLKGVRSQEGTLLISRKIRKRVQFQQINLIKISPTLGQFDLILLRNTLIYFTLPVKQQIITDLLPMLKSDGYLIVGHAETLMGVTDKLYSIQPTIYKKR